MNFEIIQPSKPNLIDFNDEICEENNGHVKETGDECSNEVNDNNSDNNSDNNNDNNNGNDDDDEEDENNIKHNNENAAKETVYFQQPAPHIILDTDKLNKQNVTDNDNHDDDHDDDDDDDGNCNSKNKIISLEDQISLESIKKSWREHKYGKYCWKSWLTLLHLIVALRALIVRIGFICFTWTAIVTVVIEKKDSRFWLLTVTILPLLIDLLLAIRAVFIRSSNLSTLSKWFSFCNFTYLICACPPIWIIELHHMDRVNNATELYNMIQNKSGLVPNVDRTIWLSNIFGTTYENESLMIMGEDIDEFIRAAYMKSSDVYETNASHSQTTVESKISSETRDKRKIENIEINEPNEESSEVTVKKVLSMQLKNLSLKEKIKILEQLLLLSVIVGRWLMPREGLTRDQLSQLLLINIGTAADILELFEAFNEREVRQNGFLRAIILSLWQASLLQFCFNKTALKKAHLNHSVLKKSSLSIKNGRITDQYSNNYEKITSGKYKKKIFIAKCMKKNKNSSGNISSLIESGSINPEKSEESEKNAVDSSSLLYRSIKWPFLGGFILLCLERPHLFWETELWAIGISLMLQDFPFLVLRITLILCYNVNSYSNVFFTCKNTLLILLQVFRSSVIISEAYSQVNHMAKTEKNLKNVKNG